jgi:hypothetical protein
VELSTDAAHCAAAATERFSAVQCGPPAVAAGGHPRTNAAAMTSTAPRTSVKLRGVGEAAARRRAAALDRQRQHRQCLVANARRLAVFPVRTLWLSRSPAPQLLRVIAPREVGRCDAQLGCGGGADRQDGEQTQAGDAERAQRRCAARCSHAPSTPTCLEQRDCSGQTAGDGGQLS